MIDRLTHAGRLEPAVLFPAVVLIASAGYSRRPLHNAAAVQRATIEQSPTEQSGFYCNLKAFTPAERTRHSALSRQIQQAKVETIELANGFAFRFQGGAISLADLAEWVSAERKCCPFFDFEIELQGNNGPLWLKLRR